MSQPEPTEEPLDAGAVGLALLLSDAHDAILAAGDEILSLGRAVVHGIGAWPLPPAPSPTVGAVAEAPVTASPAVAALPDERPRSTLPSAPAASETAPVRSPAAMSGVSAMAPVVPPVSPAPSQLSLSAALADMRQAPQQPTPAVAPTVAPMPSAGPIPAEPLPAVDYAAYAPAMPASTDRDVSMSQTVQANFADSGTAAAPSVPTDGPVAPERVQPTPARNMSVAPGALPGASRAERAASPAALHGDVFLDGVRIGRWMSDALAREAAAPPSGSTAFDPRLGPSWPGALQGR